MKYMTEDAGVISPPHPFVAQAVMQSRKMAIDGPARQSIEQSVAHSARADVAEPTEDNRERSASESAEPSTAETTEELTDAINNNHLHSKTSERKYWREPFTGIQREIWRPGDGDGVLEDDYFDRPPPLAPLEKRWRFYQLSNGPIRARLNDPPKNVILDDRACYEILQSNIPKAQLAKHWSHDFNGPGKLRHRRTHRGRPAIVDPAATRQEDKFGVYHSGKGGRGDIYIFTGERNYEPVFYRELSPEPEPELAGPTNIEGGEEEKRTKKKQHNQYTPLDQLVRNGAPSDSKTKGKYRQRLNTFLRRSASPPWTTNRERLFGGEGFARHTGFASDKFRRTGTGAVGSGFVNEEPGESMWVSPSSALDACSDHDDSNAHDYPDGRKTAIVDDDDDWGEHEDPGGARSIFDRQSSSPSSSSSSSANHHDYQLESTRSAANPRKRHASTPRETSRAAKKAKEMGYIERLAAGLLSPPPRPERRASFHEIEHDSDTVDTIRAREGIEAGQTSESAVEGEDGKTQAHETRIRDLEAQVQYLREKLRERDGELEGLRWQLGDAVDV